MCTYVTELPSMRVRKILEMKSNVKLTSAVKRSLWDPKLHDIADMHEHCTWFICIWIYAYMVRCNITYTYTWWNSWYMIHMHMCIHGRLWIYVVCGTNYKLASASTCSIYMQIYSYIHECRQRHIHTHLHKHTYVHLYVCTYVFLRKYIHICNLEGI